MSIFEKTKKMYDLHVNNDVDMRIVKLVEEVGEFSSAQLKLTGHKPYKEGETPIEVSNNRCEEIVDVLIVTMDIIHRLGLSEEELNSIVDEKLGKWKTIIDSGGILK
jgi:NTP pyrophosphatase (non-canonical NTP hydrolase)